MKSATLTHPENFTVYPGEYRAPLFDGNILQQKFRRAFRRTAPASVNFSESEHHYRIEIALPGFKKENIYIKIRGGYLNVFAINKPRHQKSQHFLIHDLKDNCFHYSIKLPADIDADFVKAEYKNGILQMWISKTEYPCINNPFRVVVY